MQRWEGKQNIADSNMSMSKSERVMERQNEDPHTSIRVDGSELLGTQKSTSQGEIDLHDDDDDGQVIQEDGLNTGAEVEFINGAEDIRTLSLTEDKRTLGEEETELKREKWTERLQNEVLYDSYCAFVLSCIYNESSFIRH